MFELTPEQSPTGACRVSLRLGVRFRRVVQPRGVLSAARLTPTGGYGTLEIRESDMLQLHYGQHGRSSHTMLGEAGAIVRGAVCGVARLSELVIRVRETTALVGPAQSPIVAGRREADKHRGSYDTMSLACWLRSSRARSL